MVNNYQNTNTEVDEKVEKLFIILWGGGHGKYLLTNGEQRIFHEEEAIF